MTITVTPTCRTCGFTHPEIDCLRWLATTSTRLDGNEQFIVRRARKLADSMLNEREVEHSGETEQRFAFAKCLGAAGTLLDDLLRIVARLDGAS
jgi:hypothetical protein